MADEFETSLKLTARLMKLLSFYVHRKVERNHRNLPANNCLLNKNFN
jgi:hypothetical protein